MRIGRLVYLAVGRVGPCYTGDKIKDDYELIVKLYI